MSGCGFLDIACMASGAFAPVFAFINAWAWLGWFVAGAIIGSIIGWRMLLAVLTLGIGIWLYDRFKPIPEPIETDLPKRDRVPAPRKKPIRADSSIFEDFMNRLGKRK
jgi:hypothetical protein